MTLVLIHAMPLDERMWAPQLEALADLELETPNLYDLGGSSVDEWARLLLERIDGELVVVGASLGGYVGLAMARQAPERVTGLLLVGSRVAADPPERRPGRDDAIRTLEADGLEAWAPNAPAPPPPERTAEEVVRAVTALRDRPDHTDVARDFDGPLWVAVGDNDPFLPVDEAREIAAAAKHGRVEIFEDTGHFPSRDRPERFNALVRELVDAAS